MNINLLPMVMVKILNKQLPYINLPRSEITKNWHNIYTAILLYLKSKILCLMKKSLKMY